MKMVLSLSTISIVSFLVAFLNQLVISKNVGTSAELDLVLYSLSFVNIIQIFSSPIADATIPFFFTSKEIDTNSASTYLSKTINLLLLISLVSIFFLNSFYDELIIYLEGLGIVNGVGNIDKYFLILSPFLFVQTLSFLLTGVLNALDRYVVQAYARLIGSILTLIFLLLFIDSQSEKAVAISMWLSLFIQSLVMICYLFKYGLRYYPSAGIVTEGKFYKIGVALLGTAVLSGLYSVYEKSILNTFDVGYISSFGFAHKVFMIPVNMFTLVLLGIIWTKLMEHLSKAGEKKSIEKMIELASEIFSLTLVFSVICFFWSEKIIYILFYRGEFNSDSLRQTAIIFKYLSLALPFSTLYSIQSKMFLSLKRSKIIGISGIILIFFMFLITWYAGYKRELVFVPISQFLAYLIATFYNFLMLRNLSKGKVFRAFSLKLSKPLLYTVFICVLFNLLKPSMIFTDLVNSNKLIVLCVTGFVFILFLLWPSLRLFKKYFNRSLT